MQVARESGARRAQSICQKRLCAPARLRRTPGSSTSAPLVAFVDDRCPWRILPCHSLSAPNCCGSTWVRVREIMAVSVIAALVKTPQDIDSNQAPLQLLNHPSQRLQHSYDTLNLAGSKVQDHVQPGRSLQDAAAAAGSTAAAAVPRPKVTCAMLILHGQRSDVPGVREAVDAARQEGHQVHVRVTWGAGDAAVFVKEAVHMYRHGNPRYDTIIAAGGDGTLNEVAGAMVQTGAAGLGMALALLPLGTANDFAAVTGISVDPAEALKVALDPSNTTPIDLGTLNGSPFINVALAGALCAVPPSETSSAAKRLLGPIAILGHVLYRLVRRGAPKPQQVVIRYPTSTDVPPPPLPAAKPAASAAAPEGAAPSPHDSSQQLTSAGSGSPRAHLSHNSRVVNLRGGLLLMAIGNARQMGRTLQVCPDAVLDDGLLDFTLLFGRAGKQVPALLADLLAPEGPALDSNSSLAQQQPPARGPEPPARAGVHMLRVPWLEVVATQPISCNRDGEPEPESSRLLFRVLRWRLLMHLPPSDLLLHRQPADQYTGEDSSAVPNTALGASSSSSSSSSSHGPKGTSADNSSSISSTLVGGSRGGRLQHHHKVSRRKMKRLTQVVHPSGWHERRRAAAVGWLTRTMVWVAAGALVGFLQAAGRRRRRRADRESAAVVAGRRQ